VTRQINRSIFFFERDLSWIVEWLNSATMQGTITHEEETKRRKKAHRSTRPDMEPSKLAFGCRARRSLCTSAVLSAISSRPDTTDEIRSILRGTGSHPAGGPPVTESCRARGARGNIELWRRVAASRSLHRARHSLSIKRDRDPADSSGWTL
jgi:hypothetical protein